MQDNPPTLAYGRQTRRWYLDRRLYYAAGLLIVLGVAAYLLKPILQPYWDQWQFLALQKRLSQPAVPEGTVIYTEDDALIARLRGQAHYHNGYNGTPTGKLSSNWSPPGDWPLVLYYALQEGLPTTNGGQLVDAGFRGIRLTPGGQERLVATGITSTPRSDTQRVVCMPYSTITLATSTHGSRGKADSFGPSGILLEWSDRLTIYVGQTDPKDANRITYAYTLNGQPGQIEYRLRDNGSLALSVVSGPAKKAPRWWSRRDPIPPDDFPGGQWPPTTRP